ncbi:hypothetical protein CAMRE0001_0448 [Campylobacter rectus RM3267]|uniref:Uncharacterized protein n=1 Tax=Campylobacter rectus RM3267 TaxID=553218 RepID=B9D3M9_CAMRE|nr:hypothetical protein CAMRE0001_0448 [Campylobacter rectus RM3267]
MLLISNLNAKRSQSAQRGIKRSAQKESARWQKPQKCSKNSRPKTAKISQKRNERSYRRKRAQ